MDRSEIGAWFDRAFEHMYAGEFAPAAACFQHVIDECADAAARRIAQRDLEWYCFPLESIVGELEKQARPLQLEELLADASHSTATSDYLDQVSAHLEQVAVVRCLGHHFWMHRSHFESAVQSVIEDFLSRNRPAAMGTLVHELCELIGVPLQIASESVTDALRAKVRGTDLIVSLDRDCVFPGDCLKKFGIELVHSIRQTNRPVALVTILDAMPWPENVKRDLQIAALLQYTCAHSKEDLGEVADGWWFIGDRVDLANEQFDHLFRDPFVPLNSERLLIECLFDHCQPPATLSESFVRSHSRRLERNPSLVKVDNDLWLLAEAVHKLTDQMLDELAQSERPRSYDDLLRAVVSSKVDCEVVASLLKEPFALRLRHNEQILEVSQDIWLHRSAMSRIADRAYNWLLDRGSAQSIALMAQCSGISLEVCQYLPPFVTELEHTLRQDNRFLCDYRRDRWIPIPRGNRANNTAYAILHREHRPLNRQQIVLQARDMPHTESLAFQLEYDARFRQMADERWLLARWILINDLAALYLADSPIPLLAETVRQKVCEAQSIDLQDAIFEPEGDPRFVRASFGKWTCRSPGRLLHQEELEQLVRTAEDAINGVVLEELVRRVLHDSPSAYHNIEQVLSDDGRLILCDGLWYPRDRCFYSVTDKDLSRIKSQIVQVGFPIPADNLARICLGRPACLTNLAEKLGGNSEFVELGSAGWIVRDLGPANIGRAREVNYPIRSGKYVPAIDLDELDSADEAQVDARHPELPGELASTDRHEGRIRSVTMPLSFEDIRDGTLVIRSRLRRLLDPALSLPALRFIDEKGASFSCWYDNENDLLQGFSNWFRSRALGFGDKICFSVTEKEDYFLVRAIGECSEQVYLDGIRRSQVQSLIDEAKRVNRSYHDLALEVLEYFDAALQIDDLWAMVNYRRVAKKQTLSAILSRRPYFVSEESGYWRLDKEEYARMIQELERKVRKLERDNKKLENQIEQLSHQESQITPLQNQVDQLRDDLVMSQAALERTESDVVRLTDDLHVAENRAHEAEELASQYQERVATFDAELADQAALISTVKEDKQRLSTDLAILTAQVETMSQRETELCRQITELESAAEETNQKLQELVRQREDRDEQIARLTIEITSLRSQTEGSRHRIAQLASDKAAAESRASRAEAKVIQLTEECHKMQADLAAARQRIDALNPQLEERNELIARWEDKNNQLELEVASLIAQTKTVSGDEAQLRERVALMEEESRLAQDQLKEARHGKGTLQKELAQLRNDQQRTVEQLADLTAKYKTLMGEYQKAMAILDSWSGRLAKWWAAAHGQAVPVWPENTRP
jgi:peptidoglycan hydrolase CwlO-like protein